MKTLYLLIVRFRIFVLAAIAVLTGYFGLQARHLQVDTDVLNYLSDRDPMVQAFKASGEKFGSNYIVMVALEADDLFAPAPLETLRQVTKTIELTKGVANVISLTNVLDMQKEHNGIVAKPLLPEGPVPTDAAWLAALKKKVLADPIYRGSLVSPDGKVALLTVRLEAQASKQDVAREIKASVKQVGGDYRLYFGGFSMIMEYMSRVITTDMTRMVPLVILLVGLMLYLGFGHWRGVLLPMGTVFLATIWTLGLMALIRMPLSMMTSAVPVILIATGTAYSIYLVARCDEDPSSAGRPPAACVTDALVFLGLPVIFTGVTTAIGFLSLMSASMVIFKQFGAAMCLGTLVAAGLSLTFVPATLALLRSAEVKRERPRFLRWADGLAGTAQYVVSRHAGLVLFVTGLVVAASLASLPHISRNVNLLSYFPPDSEPRVSEQLLMEKFGGSQIFLTRFRAESVKHPVVLHEMQALQRRLRVLPHVHYPQAGTDPYRLVYSLINEKPGLPDTVGGADALWVLLEGQPGLDQFIDGAVKEAVVMARIDSVDNAVLGEVIDQARQLTKDKVQTETAYVELAKFDSATQRRLFDAYAARLAENARLTLQFYDVPNLPSTERLRVALIALGHTPPALSATDRVTLFERLKTYFLSDESDLVIASPVVAASMASAVARLETLDDAAIREALRATVPAKLQEEDPKGIDYTLESIKARLKEISGETRVNAALAAVGKEAGVDLTDPAHRALAVDLRDDLAAVNYGFVMLPAASFKALAGRELKDKERVTLETDLTGWPPLSVKFDRELMASMIQSIVLSAAVVFLLLALQLRSLVGGLMASAPIFINQLTTFGVMSLAGIPLDNSTMMITSIAMGIGVGYTIQLIARLKLEMRGGLALPEAVHKALGTTGRAILINSAAVAAGFLVLVFSEMTPQKRFGSLIALTMFFSSFGALTLLPAIFLKRVPAFLRRAAGDR